MVLSSGIGRYLRSVLAALAHEDIELVLLGSHERIRRACPGLDCLVERLDVPVYDPREQIALARIVPDCDVFFSPHVATTRLPLRARRRVVTAHDAFHLSELSGFGPLERAYSRFLYACAIETADAVMTVSEFTKTELSRVFPRKSGAMSVVPNCVDSALFHTDPERPRSIEGEYLLFVGNLKPHKNLKLALEAARLLGGRCPRIAVAGAQEGFRHGLGEDLRALRGDRRLVLLGEVDDAELRRLYSHARALVFPSLYEGFGLPPLEAMACGCPVVCSDIPALRETCSGAAWLRDPRSAADLADGIVRALDGGAERDRMIEAGRTRAASYSRDRFEAALRPILLGGASSR